MSRNRWIAGIIASALILGLGIVLAVNQGDADGLTGDAPADGSTPVPTMSYASAAELLADTTIAEGASCIALLREMGYEDNINDVGGDDIYAWNVKAKLPVGEGGRVTSDAISTSIQSADKVVGLKEIMVENCVDPLYGGQIAHFFANATIDGAAVVELVPELAPWVGDAGALINTLAVGYMPLLDVTLELRPDCVATAEDDCFTDATRAKVQLAIAKNLEWQQVAARLNTLLTRFANVGIQSRASVLNYHLAGGGMFGTGTLPQVVLNDMQEDLPALVLEIWLKDAPCPVFTIGFNVQDSRAEQFEPGCPPRPSDVPPVSVPPKGPVPTDTTTPGVTVPPVVTTVPPSGSTVPPTTTPGTPTTVPPSTVPPTSVPPTTAPPTTVPPSTVPPTTLTPKDPSKDVNVNPNVPPQVRGPGTTPIGVDPGPATPVVDSPTGCNGPCPTTAPSPTTPTPAPLPTTPATTSPVVPTTVVDSGDGQSGVTIPAGPPPSCPVDICG